MDQLIYQLCFLVMGFALATELHRKRVYRAEDQRDEAKRESELLASQLKERISENEYDLRTVAAMTPPPW